MSAGNGWEPVGQLAGGGDVWLGPSGATLPPELIAAPVTEDERSLSALVERYGGTRNVPYTELARLILGKDELTITIRRPPPGFPPWYRPEPPALPVGPIGRAIQEIDRTISERVRILADEYGGVENVPPSELAKAADVIDWSMVIRRWMEA
ncbi:hypothetical protein [Nocardia wallacei]|uniref:hypothetical protein n=1 Tax=Nocardia wallacei TaxID=480035 RepID=UPI00245573AE|nr:hypothetical protein [Nocardia wallacei]